MDKETYEKIVGKADKRKIYEKVKFLKGFRIFGHLTDTLLQKMTYFMKEVKTNRGHIIYKQGDKADGFYLVWQGEYEVVE